MDNKKLIIIGIILLIITAGVLFVILTSVNYERIDLTPNGTSIEVPADQTEFNGNYEGAKLWNWNNGILLSYNNHEDPNFIKVTELGFAALNELIKNGEKQDIDGVECYVINADELLEIHIFDVIKVNYNGKFYCIPLANETTHDNILICCNNRDIAIHMAKSVQYKNVYPETTDLDDALESAGNLTEDLESQASDFASNAESQASDFASNAESQASDFASNADLSNIKSSIREETGVNLDDAENTINQYTEKLPI